MKTWDALLGDLWERYIEMNPQAQKIHALLEEQGETVVNDHIAFRTFQSDRMGVDVIAQPFKELGYVEKEQYLFEDKKLNAKHFEHVDANQPKIFISELKVSEFSQSLQTCVKNLVAQVTDEQTRQWNFSVSGRVWNPIAFDTYQTLKTESEYAAWLAVFGLCANHFTVLINALSHFKTIQEFNAFLKSHDFILNASGGEVKGTPSVYLEQSSTMAGEISTEFSDGDKIIPSCYYEFAKRYPLADGALFQGFVAKSADKIFESTDNCES